MTRRPAAILEGPAPAPAGAPHRPATAAATPGELRDMLSQLGALQASLQELTDLAGRKLAGLRRADTAALEACAAREAVVLNQLFRDEARRRATLARLAQTLRLAGDGPPRLERLADALPEPARSALRARAAGLAELGRQLQQKNQLAAVVARNLQLHLRGLFAELAGTEVQARGYGPQGRETAGRPRTWVDAIG